MDNTPVYIKKILALIVVFIAGFFLKNVLPYYFVIPFCLFTLAFLIARITGEKPYYLYGMGEAQKYLDKKGGFWLLFKWIFGIFGLVYDVVAMILNGLYLLFTIFADILLLIKTILYWMVHAIIWFLKLFVPPLVYLYKIALHYFIKWPWWIYKLTYRNAKLSINRNFFRVSLPGAFLSLLIFFIFWGVGVITGIHALILPGIVFALVPLAWSFGAISFIRHNNLSEEPFNLARVSFNGGFDAVRSLLVYLSLILIFLLAEVILNLLGWIPSIGFSLLGVSLNVNTLLTVFLLFLGVILLFANIILPPHIVTKNEFIPGPNESLQFLGIIGRKFLRYLAAFIPASFFSFFLLLIPALIISLSVFITLALRDNILDAPGVTLANPGTYPVVATDEGNLGGWRVSGSEYDRDPQRVEHQARMIVHTPELLRIARKLSEFAADNPEDLPADLKQMAQHCAMILRNVYCLDEELTVAAE